MNRPARPPASVLRGLVSAGLLWLALCLQTGCAGLMPQPAPPTPTPILLPVEAAATPAVPTTVRPTVTPSYTPAVTPDSAPMAAPTVTGASAAPVRAGSLIALGTQPAIVLRARPAADAAVVARTPGSQVLRVEGRSADGRWLWVRYGEGVHAWVSAAAVKTWGDVPALPVVEAVAQSPAAESQPAAAGSAADGAAARPAPAVSLTGKIAFQTSIGGDIYLVNADGTGLRRLTDGLDPALSPDGGRLAFARWGGPHGVFVLDLATGEERRVATANRPRSPAWTPDGARLAFTHMARTSSCRDTPFGCVDDGSLRGMLGGEECATTPAGRICVGDFPLRTIEEMGISQVAAGGENWLDLGALGDAQSLSWRPWGDEGLLYRGGGGLQITAPGAQTQPLVSNPAIGSPAWSPDGQRIAVQMRLHDNNDVFLLDAAGNTLARLTAPAPGARTAPDNVAPAWSPDGQSLLFLSNRDGAWRLYRMNPDGSGQTPFLPAVLGQLTFRYEFAAERVASWSP